MLAMTFFVSCEEEETIQAVIDEAELSLSTETVNFTAEAGDEATVEITSDQTVFDVNVDYAYKNWLEAELEGTTITVRTTQTNPTTEARTGVVSVVAGENGITATAYISVVQAANSSIPVLELSTDRVSLPQDASESVTVDVNTNQTISLSVDADAQSWCSAAYADGKELPLTVREFDILFKLLSSPKKTFTRSQLMNDLWDYDSSATSRTVDVTMAKLREKTAVCDGFEIVTMRGLGYKAVLK